MVERVFLLPLNEGGGDGFRFMVNFSVVVHQCGVGSYLVPCDVVQRKI